jgi:hypothetical protein
MALENFTTYTEADPNNKITITSTKVDVAALVNSDNAWVVDDKGAGNFDGDFEHLFELYTSSSGGNEPGHWAMANAVNDRDGLKGGSEDYFYAWSYRGSQIGLDEYDNGTNYQDFWGSASGSTLYYMTVERDEAVGTYGTLYLRIYSDLNRTTLLDTLTVTLHTSKKDFQYIYGFMNVGGGESTYSGYTQNLDLQEPEISVVTPTPTLLTLNVG